jgi:hypothetical protein
MFSFEPEHHDKLELSIDPIVIRILFTNQSHLSSFFLISDGFAFSQEENGVVPQDQLIRNYDTNILKPPGN